MINNLTKEELISFEDEIATLFNECKIFSPIHLSSGNEDQLIAIFKDVKQSDWVCATHRSHYAALLHGIPREWLKNEILVGHSMHINNSEHRFFSSAIVGGICPIALGIAMAIKRNGGTDKVWCFVGDSAAETGIFYECTKFASRNNLGIVFVIEDNGWSVLTPTQVSWGLGDFNQDNIKYYSYIRKIGHSGTGTWIKF